MRSIGNYMKTVMLLIILVIGEFLGLYAIYEGYKKNKKGKTGFKIKHLFQDVSFSESSGTLLIIEGITGIIAGIILCYLWVR